MMLSVLPHRDDYDLLDRAISEATGELAASGVERRLDQTLAETVRILAALHRSPEPSDAFAARLAARFAISPYAASAGSQPVARIRPARIARLPRPAFARGNFLPTLPVRRMASFVSVAALLCVMFGGMWLSVDRGGWANRTGPSTGIGVTFSGDFYPSDGGDDFIMRRITLEPGATFNDIRTGPTFFIVVEGVIRLQPNTGGPDQILGPGEVAESAYFSATIVNDSPSSVATFLDAGIYPLTNKRVIPYRFPRVRIESIATGPVGSYLTGRETFALHVVTLGGGEKDDPWTTPGSSWIVIEQGRAGLTLDGEYLPFGFEPGVERERSAGSAIALLPGVTVDARNPGSDQIRMIILTVDQAPVETPAP